MSIHALNGHPLASVFYYLDIKSRINCCRTCRLFRSTFIDPKNQTILWSKKTVCGFPAKSLASPFVASILDRTLAKPDEKAVATLEKHSGFALSFLSFGDFVISCDESSKVCGETKIWHAHNLNLVAILPPLAKKFTPISNFRVSFTIQGNWLIRSTFEIDDRILSYVDVWKLDPMSGQPAHLEILHIAFPYQFFASSTNPVNPVRDKNRLFICLPFTNAVHVYTLKDNTFEMTTEILCEVKSSIKSLKIENDQLLVESLEAIQAVNLSDYKLEPPQPLSHEDLKCDEWVVRSDYQAKCDFVLGKDKTYQLPHPEYVYRDPISFRKTLSTHQYVIGYLNKCAIYNLWNMKSDATPNHTLELPEDSFILATHLHKGTIFVSTIDGKIWMFS